MIVAGVVIGVGVVAGVAATATAWGWSRSDPTDPHLERQTVRRFLREHPLVKRLARRHHPEPSAATAEALGLAAAAVVIGTATAGVILLMIKTRSGFARADTPFAHWAAEQATEASTEIMRAVSEFGGTTYVVVAALAVTAIELLRDRRWTIPAFVAMTIGGQFLLSNGIKWIVDRARPSISPLTGFAGTSFPSGHAVAAAATWACVAFLLGRRRHRHARAVLLGGAVTIAVAVAATRVALGVHWTTDVVAGLFVGWTWFALCAIVSVAGCCTSANRLRSSRPRRTNRSPFAPRKPVADADGDPARVTAPRAGRPPPSRSWRCDSICALTPNCAAAAAGRSQPPLPSTCRPASTSYSTFSSSCRSGVISWWPPSTTSSATSSTSFDNSTANAVHDEITYVARRLTPN